MNRTIEKNLNLENLNTFIPINNSFIISSFNNNFEEDTQKSSSSIDKKKNYNAVLDIEYDLDEVSTSSSPTSKNNFQNKIIDNKNYSYDSENLGNMKKSDSLNIFPNNEDYFDIYKTKLLEEVKLPLYSSNLSPNKKINFSPDSSSNLPLNKKIFFSPDSCFNSSPDSSSNLSPDSSSNLSPDSSSNLFPDSSSNLFPNKKINFSSISTESRSLSRESNKKVKKQLFFSHSWEKDELNRDNHTRVKLLVKMMEKFGWTTWFDEYDMKHNIDVSLSDGIEDSEATLICLTKSYLDKVNKNARIPSARDNCLKEWNYATSRKKIIIPIIMEESLKDISKWSPGIANIYLGNLLYIDYSNNNTFDIAASLHKYLRKINLKPSNFNEKTRKNNFLRSKDNKSFKNFYNLINFKIFQFKDEIKKENKRKFKDYKYPTFFYNLFTNKFNYNKKKKKNKVKI